MDGASSNRKLIKLHKGASDATEVVYKVANPFAEDKRNLYFMSDPPHLVKTMQNCWNKRRLWVSIKMNANLLISNKLLHNGLISAMENLSIGTT